MIDEALLFLKNELNTFLTPGGGGEAKVQFPSEEPGDAVKFPLNCISPILIRVEEEKILRQDDRFLRSKTQDGFVSAPPAIPLHLFILFVSRFHDYKEGLKSLAQVIRFFQGRPYFTPVTHPALPAHIPELKMELHTPTYTVQNEIWSSLKAPYHPSVIYKATVLMLEDTLPPASDKVVGEVKIGVDAFFKTEDLAKARDKPLAPTP